MSGGGARCPSGGAWSCSTGELARPALLCTPIRLIEARAGILDSSQLSPWMSACTSLSAAPPPSACQEGRAWARRALALSCASRAVFTAGAPAHWAGCDGCRYFRRLQKRYAPEQSLAAAGQEGSQDGSVQDGGHLVGDAQDPTSSFPVTCINLLRCSMQVRPLARIWCSAHSPVVLLDQPGKHPDKLVHLCSAGMMYQYPVETPLSTWRTHAEVDSRSCHRVQGAIDKSSSYHIPRQCF